MVTPASEEKLNVLVFAASLRADSLNGKLASLAAQVARQNGAKVDHGLMRPGHVLVGAGAQGTRRRRNRRRCSPGALRITSGVVLLQFAIKSGGSDPELRRRLGAIAANGPQYSANVIAFNLRERFYIAGCQRGRHR